MKNETRKEREYGKTPKDIKDRIKVYNKNVEKLKKEMKKLQDIFNDLNSKYSTCQECMKIIDYSKRSICKDCQEDIYE